MQLATGSSRRRARGPARPRAIPVQSGEATIQAARRIRPNDPQDDDAVAVALEQLGSVRTNRFAARFRD